MLITMGDVACQPTSEKATGGFCGDSRALIEKLEVPKLDNRQPL